MILLKPKMKPKVFEFVAMPVVAQEARMHLYQVIKRAGIRFHIKDEKEKRIQKRKYHSFKLMEKLTS